MSLCMLTSAGKKCEQSSCFGQDFNPLLCTGRILTHVSFRSLSRFKHGSQNGLPPVTFTNTTFVAGVLLVNIAFTAAGTKRRLGNQHMWKHSATNYAKLQWVKLHSKLEEPDDDNLGESATFVGDGSSCSWESRRHSLQTRSAVDLSSLPTLCEVDNDSAVEIDC